MAHDELLPEEIEQRVVFATLAPMALLAAECAIPLRQIKQTAELAYYRELRRRRFKMDAIQTVMGIGFSKVGSLSRQLKDYWAQPGAGLGLKRRVLLMLWAVPLSQKHLHGVFQDVGAQALTNCLEEMVAEGLLEVDGPQRTPVYRLSSAHNTLVGSGLLVRLEALHSLMENIALAIRARFFRPEEQAFVRTLNFRARPQDIEKLEAAYREVIIPLVNEIDDAVDDTSLPIKLSFVWAQDSSRQHSER